VIGHLILAFLRMPECDVLYVVPPAAIEQMEKAPTPVHYLKTESKPKQMGAGELTAWFIAWEQCDGPTCID
jgi:hypothetical protein